MAHAIQYRRLRAPRQQGEALIDPPLAEAAELVRENIATSRARYDEVHLQGESLERLRTLAREELFAAAVGYTRQTLGNEATLPEQAKSTFIVAGHQPELFHPGVWLKNFVLSSLGQQLDATAINLIIDNDKAHPPGIRVPQQQGDEARVEWRYFDERTTERPYEEQWISDEARFASFPKSIDPAGKRLISALWKLAPTRERNLGLRLAAARHRLEHAHGLQTLEVPLSTICQSRSFAWFSLHLLLELPRLQEAYNGALAEYRQANHVRSAAHPVPELARQGKWLEAPFWMWTSTSPARRPLHVQHSGDVLLLSDRAGVEVSIPLTSAGGFDERSIAAWQACAERGIKLRPRALVTTMFARLLLSDLFLHGIGGAKYDQLTDAIIEQFFGITPPHFLTVTATLKLYDFDAAATAKRLRAVEHRLRELPYHPETVPGITSPEFAALREKKQRVVGERPAEGSSKAWHDRIVALNEQLLGFVADEQAKLLREREELTRQLHEQTLLGSREFSFGLFTGDLIEQLQILTR